jgi:hypothetical protein
MPNKNILSDMRCPKCKSYEPFRIEIKTLATVWDSGTDIDGDNEWNNASYCECLVCYHYGVVSDFDEVDRRRLLKNT